MFLGKYIQTAGNESHEIQRAEIGAPSKSPKAEEQEPEQSHKRLLFTYFCKAAVEILKGRTRSLVPNYH